MTISVPSLIFQALQQAITDHEPEFVSLKRGAQKLCEGPSEEAEYFEHVSQVQEHPSGQDLARPGQQQQQETLADYEARLEALKGRFSEAAVELGTQLEKGNKFESGMAGLSDWLSSLEGDMDGLKVHDPKSSAIKAQQGRCQVWKQKSNNLLIVEIFHGRKVSLTKAGGEIGEIFSWQKFPATWWYL